MDSCHFDTKDLVSAFKGAPHGEVKTFIFTIFALSTGFLQTKINIGKQVTSTPLTFEVRGVLVTCISNIDFLKPGTRG